MLFEKFECKFKAINYELINLNTVSFYGCFKSKRKYDPWCSCCQLNLNDVISVVIDSYSNWLPFICLSLGFDIVCFIFHAFHFETLTGWHIVIDAKRFNIEISYLCFSLALVEAQLLSAYSLIKYSSHSFCFTKNSCPKISLRRPVRCVTDNDEISLN